MTDEQPPPRSDRTSRNALVEGTEGFPAELIDRPADLPGDQAPNDEPGAARPDQATSTDAPPTGVVDGIDDA